MDPDTEPEDNGPQANIAASVPKPKAISLPVLMKAIEQKNLAEVQRIVGIDAKILLRSTGKTRKHMQEQLPFKITPLMAAIVSEDMAIFDFILNKDATNINDQNTHGYTAIYYAYLIKNNEMISKLLEKGANPSKTTEIITKTNIPAPESNRMQQTVTPFNYVVAVVKNPNGLEELKTILSKSTNYNAYEPMKWYLLILLIIENPHAQQKAMLTTVLDKIAETKYKHFNLGNILKLTDTDSKTLFMKIAEKTADPELFDILYSRWPYISLNYKDEKGNNIFHYLAKNKSPNSIQLFKYITEKIKTIINIPNNLMITPFTMAVQNRNEEYALAFLETVTKPLNREDRIDYLNKKYNNGETILFNAVRYRLPNIINFLIDQGIDVTIKNNDGKLPKDVIVDPGQLSLVPYAAKILGLVGELRFKSPSILLIDQLKYALYNSRNISFCPVCLLFVNADEGCIYLHHACKASVNRYMVHEELFNTYNLNKYISWCKLCGDITDDSGGGHRHLSYHTPKTPGKGTRMPIVYNQQNQNEIYFQLDTVTHDNTCKMGGGKGYLNKYNRIFTYYNKLCYYQQQLQQGVKLKLKDVFKDIVETVWESSLNNPEQDPEKRPPNMPKAKEIMDILHPEFNAEFMSFQAKLTSNELPEKTSINTILDQDAIVKRVNEVLEQHKPIFICELESTLQANSAVSNIGQTVQEEITLSESDIAERTTYITNLNNKIANEGFPLYERTEEELDKKGEDNLEESNNGKPGIICRENYGPHNDDPTRPIYEPIHYQIGQNKHLVHEGFGLCAAEFREKVETLFDVPMDRLIEHDQDFIVGVQCIFAGNLCSGNVYPDMINQIPSEEFYRPTMMDPNTFTIEERTQKGDAFKKLYNNMFHRNHLIYDNDNMIRDRNVMRGGGANGEFLSSIDQLLGMGEAEASCPIPHPKPKAGNRARTYRKRKSSRRR